MHNSFKLILGFLAFLFLGILPSSSTGQIFQPVKWSFCHDQVSENQFKLQFKATIDPGWHMYSLDAGEGPISTSFDFPENAGYKLEGTVKEPKPHREYDPNFESELAYFEHEATFTQLVNLKPDQLATLIGELTYMVCTDSNCLPPEYVEFSFDLPGKVNCAGEPMASIGEDNGDDGEEGDGEESGSFWASLLTGLAGGFLALLTPCVFPMIPLTVSFFTKQSKTKAKGISNAILYGTSIIVLYTGLGVLITLIFGKDALHAMSTGVIFNMFLFVLLVVFAISFFGAFEITLPAKFVNKLDSASDKGGMLGIFFMAATLSVVSFSCTGPIIGSAISVAGVGEMTTTMFGFALALALPFGLFAAFPGWLNSLPKSGGWLNSVKVTLGFLELAFAFKFLSNADLVEQWHILPRELFLAIWIALFAMMAMYLLGFIKFPHDSPLDRIPVPRALVGMSALVFTLYLIPGLWGAPLKMISGFPPPDFYAEYPYGLYKQGGGGHATPAEGTSAASDGGHCPQNLNCFHDYETGLSYAKEVNKPVLLDFTGWACVNCRKMEEQVWADAKVWKRLNEEFVIVSLYVDQSEKLPKEDRFFSESLEKEVTRVGQKWVDFEISKFDQNTQPLYVVIDHEGNPLHETASYDPNVSKFVGWLDRGKALFESGNKTQTASTPAH